MNKKVSLVLFACIAGTASISAQITMPKIFSDNMILQRDKPLKIWGWASRGENVQVSFHGQTGKAVADNQGKWSVTLKPMHYDNNVSEMKISCTENTIEYKNILLGDVWICGGQSNMEFPISGWTKVNNAEQEIANANHPTIRLFTVEKSMNYLPAVDLKGGTWLECNPQNIPPFSAVAYFFGRKLNEDLKIPIGLINSNWGGTQIQEWIGWDSLSKLPEYKNINPNDSDGIAGAQAKAKTQYENAMKNDVGDVQQWFNPQTNIDGWQNDIAPKDWSQTLWHDATGTVWYRKEIVLTASQAAQSATLNLGVIDDKDVTYVNGKKIGETDNWYTSRSYALAKGLLKEGKNVIVVKLTNAGGGGGFESNANLLSLKFSGNDSIPLAIGWSAKPSALSTQFGLQEQGPNSFPAQLYNAMIAPFDELPIKGVIWYQGEQNTNTFEAAEEYRKLFPMLIRDWRAKRNYEFPFLWVQLTRFNPGSSDTLHSNWALVREGQHKALALPKTGEAVIIDLGASHNVHPTDKQDVGYRLALAGLKVAYGKNIIYSGPVFQSMKKEGNKLVLSFSNIGTGLLAKGSADGTLKGFVIAGNDKKFAPANAIIKGNTVIVFSDEIKNPVAVRYGWADDPQGINLYNKESLPASPFRTDNWND
ncbi:hypothetical protein A9P82_02785 [Arachidicoccus ginsenosidimutans]|uniref:sialate O-acetylesterase n=1 Tax=Arachidicoccus sp. BS20 TaxID=1850526 RepID=UPI0007F05C62|nr:sialate O-acetylesterase [Arachidicoccus sp. BS20]ANI88322.1 hypothetical protein A9P82_02785 [Arachidicoccus sp. BS20]